MESYCGASMTFHNIHSFADLLPESWLQFPNLHKPEDHAAALIFRKLKQQIFSWKWLSSCGQFRSTCHKTEVHLLKNAWIVSPITEGDPYIAR